MRPTMDLCDPPRRTGNWARLIDGLLVKGPAEGMVADRAIFLPGPRCKGQERGRAAPGAESSDNQPTRRERT